MSAFFYNSTMISKEEWLGFLSKIRKNKPLNSKKKAKELLKNALIMAIKKEATDKRFGILFSGGIDSSLIAFISKKLGLKFNCYCVGLKDAEDIVFAEKAAKKLKINLKKKILTKKEIENDLKWLAKLVPEFDTIKAGVGCVTYEGLKLVRKSGIKVIFTGLGSEEVFAGYKRHLNSNDVNEECWKGLETMYERDFIRDFVIAEKLGIALRTPFLDEEVIKIGMSMPAEWKIDKKIPDRNKLILREIAIELGLPKEIAFRKKRAAQYGSKIDKVIEKLAKENGFKNKINYLKSLK
ncbi:MAG: asparagine synthase-related protein [Candidatus Woesearchaeota archaeon]|nr:asparagine synthase-related protein [Candidatus Woesearchaeota archaeon]